MVKLLRQRVADRSPQLAASVGRASGRLALAAEDAGLRPIRWRLLRRRWKHPLATALLATAALAACPCDSGLPDLFYDGLQEVCDGLPCGWTREAGDVVSVATFHSGERGLRLAVGGAASRDLPAVSLPGTADQGAVVSLIVACDAQTALVVEVTATSDLPDQTSGDPVALLLVARREPEPGDRAGGVLALEELVLALPGGEDVPPATATALRVWVDGPGVCTFDELHLASGRSFSCGG